MSLFDDGYELIDNFISTDCVDTIKQELAEKSITIKGGGIRNAEKKIHSVRALVESKSLQDSAQRYLGDDIALVRVILFDKTPENNWLVSWHQDKTIAVSKRIDIAGWGPWSVKEGIHHVQPDVAVLNKMVTFRIHIDDSSAENGCLRLIPRSHLQSLMSHEEIQQMVKTQPAVLSTGRAGSALVMRPHLLHASSKAQQCSQRRVLHIEFSSFELPSGDRE